MSWKGGWCMYIKNKMVTLTYRLTYVGLCGYGILRHLSVSDSIRNINMLSYFTIQSNIVCFFVMLASAIHSILCIIKDKDLKYSRALSFFRGMAFLVITITFFTYSIVLTQTGFTMGNSARRGMTINDLFVHYMIPICTLVDYFLFQPKPSFKRLDPVKWLWAPFIYFVFILIKGKYFDTGKSLVGIKRYPYYFLDAGQYGYLYVFKYAFVFLIGCIIIGYVFWLIDFILGLIDVKIKKIVSHIKNK